MSAEPNRYTVEVREGPSGWEAVIRDPAGAEAHRRACPDEAAARLYASTVRQHVYWLSEDRFRRYYRLPEPEG